MLNRTSPTDFTDVSLPTIFADNPERRARLISLLRDAGAAVAVLGLIGIGFVLPFCG